MRYPIAFVLFVAACGGDNNNPKLDGHAPTDSRPIDAHRDGTTLVDGSGGGGSAVSHTIAIDGTDDFTAGETFATTSSPTFSAYVTWDAVNIYIGYAGPDLATTTSDAGTKWLFAYVDVDPGAATGATVSQRYNTQQITMPAGFGAEHYFRFKSDGTLRSQENYNGSDWASDATTPTSANAGMYTEAAIPRALFAGNTAGLVTYMINEQDGAESTFAGLYNDNFVDGYSDRTAPKALLHYLRIDFTSHLDPDSGANEEPSPIGADI